MYLLTQVDLFFYKMARSCTHQVQKNQKDVALALYEIFLSMGFPPIISSDQGRECVNSYTNG